LSPKEPKTLTKTKNGLGRSGSKLALIKNPPEKTHHLGRVTAQDKVLRAATEGHRLRNCKKKKNGAQNAGNKAPGAPRKTRYKRKGGGGKPGKTTTPWTQTWWGAALRECRNKKNSTLKEKISATVRHPPLPVEKGLKRTNLPEDRTERVDLSWRTVHEKKRYRGRNQSKVHFVTKWVREKKQKLPHQKTGEAGFGKCKKIGRRKTRYGEEKRGLTTKTLIKTQQNRPRGGGGITTPTKAQTHRYQNNFPQTKYISGGEKGSKRRDLFVQNQGNNQEGMQDVEARQDELRDPRQTKPQGQSRKQGGREPDQPQWGERLGNWQKQNDDVASKSNAWPARTRSSDRVTRNRTELAKKGQRSVTYPVKAGGQTKKQKEGKDTLKTLNPGRPRPQKKHRNKRKDVLAPWVLAQQGQTRQTGQITKKEEAVDRTPEKLQRRGSERARSPSPEQIGRGGMVQKVLR